MSHPFFGEEFTFAQPDGTTIRVRGWGDQQHAVFETLDGQPLRRDPVDGRLVVVASAEAARALTFPQYLRAPVAARSAAAPPLLGSAVGLPTAGCRWQRRRTERTLGTHIMGTGPLPAPPQRQTVGAFVGLCLLVDFPDVPGTIPQAQVDAFCNQPGFNGFGNHGSVRDYFLDVSGARVDYRNLVAPYYTAKYPREYYTDEGVDQPVRTIELIKEALDALLGLGLDFSSLSVDDQDFVYALNVFYAGDCVNSWAKGLWPHAHHLTSNYRVRPDASVYDYQITNMGNELTLGTFCHENGHMLCDFPDLYDYGGESYGAGVYCLMCAGGSVSPKNPAHVGAYLKFLAGWAGNVIPLTPGTTVTLNAHQNEFALLRHSSTEYLIVENRQRLGRDAALPTDGLAIWHVDELGDNSNEESSPTRHYECALIQADGQLHLEHKVNIGDTGDLYRAGQSSLFGPTTVPAARWWDGTPSPVELLDIGPSNAAMSLTVR